MALRNSAAEFGSMAKALHWLIAIGIFWLLYLGLEQSGMERGPAKLELRAFHGSVALVVLVLMTVRLVWRLMNEVPAHPADMPAWQQALATVVHWGIYAAVFVQLLSGPITVATGGKPLAFFGLFSISLPIAEDRDSHHFWEGVHEFAWKIVALLLIVHVVAALYNHFVTKNTVLRRMTTGIQKRV